MRDERQDGGQDRREGLEGGADTATESDFQFFCSGDYGFLLKVTSGYLAEGPFRRSLSCPRKYLSKNASV